jgi:O-antigen/teichoic acid export membrane protein
MKTHLPPRLRAPVLFAVLALATLAIGGATHGWKTLVDIVPIPIIVMIGLYVWGRRDSDASALIRGELDERQASERLKVQALVGRVLSFAVAVAYIVASASRTSPWPWAVLLGLMVAAFLTGWLIYGEHRWRTPPQQ